MSDWKKWTLIAVLAASFGIGTSSDLSATQDQNAALNISNPSEQVAWRYYYWGGPNRWHYWHGPRWGNPNYYYWHRGPFYRW